MRRFTDRLSFLLLPLVLLACAACKPEATLRARARDSFPELTQTAHARLPEHVALRVLPPETEGGVMKLVTRGSTFLVRPLGVEEGPTARHLLSAGGKQGEVDGAWLAHQAQDFLLLEGGQVHQSRYEVTLPEGVVSLRDANGVIDFLDASGKPVLRFHYPEARDAEGRSFQARVRVLGAVPVSSGVEGLLTVSSRILTLEVVLELGEVRGLATVAYVWSSTASMPESRAYHLMARLPGGKALVFGGFSRSNNTRTDLRSAVVYDEASMTWSFTGSMATTHFRGAAVALPDGRVLVTGGDAGFSSRTTAELYDPASGTWSAAAPMAEAQGRYRHTATLLPDGRVLVVGGWGTTTGPLASAEVYDPASNTWTATSSLSVARYAHTATLLKDGTVLVVGGINGPTTPGVVELYDPVTGTWSLKAPSSGRGNHTATLLEDGRVLLVGGQQQHTGDLSACELFDPSTGTWSTTGALAQPRSEHEAARLPNGRVVVLSGTYGLTATEEYNPATGTWSSAGTLTTGQGSRRVALSLESGNILVTGGDYGPNTFSSAELYGPVELGWEPTGSFSVPRSSYTLTLLADGRVVAMGGQTGFGTPTPSDSVEVYDPGTGTWRSLNPMPLRFYGHSATLLADGRILVAGGHSGTTTSVRAFLYEPNSDTWSSTGLMHHARFRHSATLLKDGRVLIAGGGVPSSAELYDPATGTFQLLGSLGSSRSGHVAVRLADGRVLLAGGYGSSSIATAELFDPATGTLQPTGSLSVPRYEASGALLRDGKVLVAGGFRDNGGSTRLATAELYDPLTGTFSSTGSMAVARSSHGGIALETGNVVVMGGATSGGSATATAELYEASMGTFRPLRRMREARSSVTPVLLRTGKVLVTHGSSYSVELGPINNAPVAHSASVTTKEDQQVAVTLSGTDEDGERLEYELVSPPAHGTLSGEAPDLTYVPAANYSGTDSFTFRVSDGLRLSAEATLSVTVTPVNDAPTAPGGAVTTAEDTAVEVVLVGADVEGDALAYTVVTGPAHGTLSGTPPRLLYTPAANASGHYSFTFRVGDGQESSAEATVVLFVSAVNDTPVARSAQVTTKQGSAVEVTLGATDVEWGELAYTVVRGPAHGSLTGTPPRLTYTPEPGFSGEDSFTFTARDGGGAVSNEATVSITLTPRGGNGGGSGGCSAMGGEWPLGGLWLLLLGAHRSRRRLHGSR